MDLAHIKLIGVAIINLSQAQIRFHLCTRLLRKKIVEMLLLNIILDQVLYRKFTLCATF